MKRKTIAKCILPVLLCSSMMFAGCANEGPEPVMYREILQKAECLGNVPEKLENVVRNNVFCGITAFEDRILKAEIVSEDEKNRSVTQKVTMMDLYGGSLASYTVTSDDACHVSTLTATDDGGFLFVLGFSDRAYDKDGWASDNGYASRIIKCDKNGDLQFDTALDETEGSALRFCFEKDGKFYFFGTGENPDTKKRGTYSKTDVTAVALDGNGSVLQSRRISGSDFDSLKAAEVTDAGFVLSVRSQSDDGDFAGSDSGGYPVGWIVTLNDHLEITDKKKESGRDYFDDRIGFKEGKPLYKSSELLKNFDTGRPEAYLDYGDFTMIISENNTGIYEKTPLFISSTWYYTETVYSGYDKNGDLIFRASVDSSPDYDAMVRKIDSKTMLWDGLE